MLHTSLHMPHHTVQDVGHTAHSTLAILTIVALTTVAALNCPLHSSHHLPKDPLLPQSPPSAYHRLHHQLHHHQYLHLHYHLLHHLNRHVLVCGLGWVGVGLHERLVRRRTGQQSLALRQAFR